MTAFRPCLGQTACTEGGDHCRSCGRSFEEIERTRELVNGLARLALAMDYGNPQAFADHVARRLVKKGQHAREEAGPAA
jgi:hypothetical protein